MKEVLIALLLSISPVSELRGGIPYAITKGISPITTFFLCVMANILVIFLIFLFLDFLHDKFLKIKVYEKMFLVVLSGMQKRSKKIEHKIDLYGFPALAFFTAIPLPITGAWTSTIVAWLLNLDRKKSILAISVGVTIAGVIVSLISLGIINIFT